MSCLTNQKLWSCRQTPKLVQFCNKVLVNRPINCIAMAHLTIPSDEENRLKVELEKRTDSEAARIKRYLNMDDLARREQGPIRELVNNIVNLEQFNNFDIITIPEIVPASASFDLFNFPADHPARSKSDTYYVDEENILRTHTTVMWYYYFQQAETRAKIAANEALGVLSYGK